MASTMRTRTGMANASPRLSIQKILKRRKKTLKKLTQELGLTTLCSLERWCERIGVAPPSKEEWENEFGSSELPPLVNDPSDGIIVITQSDVINTEDENNIVAVVTDKPKLKKKKSFRKLINDQDE